ncbi:hypothetical protein MA47_08185 [Corynebacterium auriscanis]|uniref:ZIP family zinc transporter n=2 Tax=Corynebacterium auriscanis TaxID=99807 RepID=A0A0A2DGS4_9CORY|nr:hypothetical protein MA47_08185 [Corynebacterium auriscanis]
MLMAIIWGFVAASSLIIGALLGFARKWPNKLIGSVLALGGGALVASISFELAEEGIDIGGPAPVGIGLAVGALTYFTADRLVSQMGSSSNSGTSRRHGRAGSHNAIGAVDTLDAMGAMGADGSHGTDSAHGAQSESSTVSDPTGPVAPPHGRQKRGGGTSLAVGAFLDGIPEQAVLGLGLASGSGISAALLVAIFISNLPEAIGSSNDMHEAGVKRSSIFWLWIGVAAVCTLATFGGFMLADSVGGGMRSAIDGFAAGALLVMLVDSLIPEAREKAGNTAGLVTVMGFAVAAGLSLLA